MPNKDWKTLSKNRQKFGTYGEYYAKMEFASYGFDVFTSEVDDHGVDFIIKGKNSFCEIQVKSVKEDTGYVFMKKRLFDVENEGLYLCLLIFRQDELPDVYLIPAHAWKEENELLRNRDYDKPGQKSEPEWGVNISKKNQQLLQQYCFESMIEKL